MQSTLQNKVALGARINQTLAVGVLSGHSDKQLVSIGAKWLPRCSENQTTSTRATMNRQYYEDAEVAALLGVTVGRLRNKLSAGDPLPPRIKPDGCRRRIWPSDAVHEWMNKFVADDILA